MLFTPLTPVMGKALMSQTHRVAVDTTGSALDTQALVLGSSVRRGKTLRKQLVDHVKHGHHHGHAGGVAERLEECPVDQRGRVHACQRRRKPTVHSSVDRAGPPRLAEVKCRLRHWTVGQVAVEVHGRNDPGAEALCAIHARGKFAEVPRDAAVFLQRESLVVVNDRVHRRQGGKRRSRL